MSFNSEKKNEKLHLQNEKNERFQHSRNNKSVKRQ